MALGLWLALAPQRPGELWFGEPDPPAAGTALLRCVGGRDLGIGLGLTANATPDSLWLRVGILADVIDGVATLAASRQMPRAGARRLRRGDRLLGHRDSDAARGRDRTADRSGIAQG
ncbi:hypothetical protein MSEO_51720 [Mycobacterium seoulense]|uniref:Uncharacterized protein n=1 Tax=Mycobacterium seoulense TaxID=386911 RepID=A0A7I7P6Z5_9MYCO|nr:hypothetical protein MSEO_51720 [Mycobacterium seoulense]